jgi:acetyl esterase/lipase
MPTRRAILATMGALALFPRTSNAAPAAAASLALWPGTPPEGGGPSGDVEENAKGAISNIAVPKIDIYQPTSPNGMAVLIAAGGGYKRIEMRNEALPAARWLNARGITAFVLSYRLPDEGWAAGPLAPLQDAQRALRLIQANAGKFKIDPERLGVLGFSAGGHLLGMAAARSAFASYPAIDDADALPARPAFAALVYPIITLKPPYDHTSTRKVLIGGHPSPALSSEWSVEDHVKARCPPVFLAQAEDDPVSDPQNTLIMQAACEQAHVPVELHRLADGGHGFGMGKPGTASMQWPGYFASWLDKQPLSPG